MFFSLLETYYFSVIQVQHTHMTDTAAADYATVELIVNTLHWLFPDFDYRYFKVLYSCLLVNIQSARLPKAHCIDAGRYLETF